MIKQLRRKSMVRSIRSLFAYGLAGFLVPYLWSRIAQPFGNWAGFIAGMLIIFPLWYLVHYRGLAVQEEDMASIDMGMAIGIAVFVKTSLSTGLGLMISSLPTLIIMGLGASLAGLVVARYENGRK
ncbi:hypothetical protein K6969_00530 [Streptococcus suis]|uniref:Lin0368 family putative glycerol transporter subunit n=1 Tax=Streptococcus suis TaxID=1307 RepID=UPI0003F812D7|nr:hypothetical protein [Streptococcus suis]QZT29457.1 hypothetical protein K6969_00530 [Streptococcus suis]HEM3165774.1 hypothetical protein [Streptococcus suis 92-1191]HEM6182901.1 hypothetical protein [Streptococcus suis]